MGPSNKRRKLIIDGKAYSFVMTFSPEPKIFLTDKHGRTQHIPASMTGPRASKMNGLMYGSKHPRWSCKLITAIVQDFNDQCIHC